ncbi:MAG TPA: PKD domain-containing protein [Bacillota bacterium]|nr:PKD domain-containing protein [Bacillota bacterium]
MCAAPLAHAQITPPGPSSGSAGLQGKVQTPPPKTAATIAIPSNGAVFTSIPIAVSGLCTKDLLIKIFANNVFVGSVMCGNGSYSLQISLLDGRNDLVARQFDNLDQPGPDSNIVTVTYNNTQFATNNIPQLTLSSPYARRGANPGEELQWPITIAGGTSPYALSVDWGDGKPATLYSEPVAGTFTMSHVYASPGSYVVIVKATDKNGETAYLQLVAVANGAVSQTANSSSSGKNSSVTKIIVLWIPAALMIPLIITSYWLGRRSELLSLRRHLERPR